MFDRSTNQPKKEYHVPKKNNSLTGMAGEHFVCAELARRGYVAVPAPRGNPLFDILVTNQEGSVSVSVQVKTKAADNKQGWKVGKSFERERDNEALFVVLVDLSSGGAPDFYVYDYDVLAKRLADLYRDYKAIPKRDGSPRKDVDFRWFDHKYMGEDDERCKNNWMPITDRLRSLCSRI
jgi:hypothetical protein